jgi:hypothetical protein
VDFFKDIHLSGKPLATQKTPYIKYDWGNRAPARGLPFDRFSARWSGRFSFKEGQYEFLAQADDGVRIRLDGRLILDHWFDTPASDYRATVTPGTGMHLVEVEYFEAIGNARLMVNWKQSAVTSAISTVAASRVPTVAAASVPLETSVAKTQSKPDIPAITVAGKSTHSATTTQGPVSQEQVAPARNVDKAPIGINLSPFSYYSPTIPFKDLMMQNGGFTVLKQGSNDPCPEQPALDQEGYPNSLPNDCTFRIWIAFHILGDDFWPAGTPPYQPGHYVLLYQGRGKLRLGWDATNVEYKNEGRIEFDVPTPYAGIQIEITSMAWNDPVRDMHIVHDNDEESFREQPFNQKWLTLLSPFQLLRFMDWGKVSSNESVYSSTAVSHTAQSVTLPDSAPDTDGAFANMVALLNIDGKWPRVMIDSYDGETRTLYFKSLIETSGNGKQPTVNIYNFLNRTWAERALPNTLGQATPKGVAFETMIKLANTLNVDPWINIPTAADDKFVEQLAWLIKTSLKPGLKCYLEYSNETWNYGYPGYHYSEAKARQLELTGTWIQADAWQAYRAVEIFKIFNRVFGEPDLHEARSQSRLVRVLTSQTAWLDRAKMVMDWQMPNNALPTQGHPAYKYADAWAVTTYFYLDEGKSLESLSIEELFAAQLDNVNSLFGDSKTPGLIRNILAEAKSRNLQLVAYEGGTHVLAPQNNAELIAKVAQINKDPRMKEVYSVLLNHWNKLYQEFGGESVGVLNHYSDISRYGKYGFWGLLQSSYQNPAIAPKYQAIRDYVSGP